MFVSRLNSFLSNVTTRLYKGDTNEKECYSSWYFKCSSCY